MGVPATAHTLVSVLGQHGGVLQLHMLAGNALGGGAEDVRVCLVWLVGGACEGVQGACGVRVRVQLGL